MQTAFRGLQTDRATSPSNEANAFISCEKSTIGRRRHETVSAHSFVVMSGTHASELRNGAREIPPLSLQGPIARLL
jgi:hypothetical protein